MARDDDAVPLREGITLPDLTTLKGIAAAAQQLNVAYSRLKLFNNL
jgi:hypothetical protein